MDNSKYKILFQKNTYVIIFCLFILFLALNSGYAVNPHKDEILAADGIMDLGTWDFSVNESVQLNGQWEFYWKQLLYPSDFSETAQQGRIFANVPSIWNAYEIAGEQLGVNGYATYRLVINTTEAKGQLALRIPNILTAHKLWVNGELISQDGNVISKSKDINTDYYTKVVFGVML